MRLRTKVLLGIFVTLLVALLALLFVAYRLVTKSFPETTGTIILAGIQSDVTIARDEYGVPHILADHDTDAYFAVGFLHAQDRLWQMELMRRAGMGRLAEVLGKDALPIDRMFRTLGFPDLARQLENHLDDSTRSFLEAYVRGVNAFLESHRGRFPLEFDILNFTPEPWTVTHSMLISRLMAWDLNYARWSDIIHGVLAERFGEAKVRELFPDWDPRAPLIIPGRPRPAGSVASALGLLEADLAYRRLVGLRGFSGGSNAWAVAGSRSTTGRPILANDPHLQLTAPARWYEVRFMTPQLEVAGATLAGVPFVVIGQNRSIAWGVTNAMLDDEDFYVEEVDSLQFPTVYRFNNTWRTLGQRIDTILVRDSAPVLLTTYLTHRGPIINRMEPAAEFASRLISMRWVGHELTNEPRAFSLINRAHTWREFVAALRHFGLPAQNFVFADAEGTIGYRTGGLLPLRPTKGPTLPFDGTSDRHDWRGFVPFHLMPQRVNPPEGYIATANNKIVADTYPYYISYHWEPPWRITRINELLQQQEKFAVEDFQRMQQDVFSVHARDLVPVILAAFERATDIDRDVRDALTYFRNWDFEMRTADVATSLFQAFLVRAVRNTFEDEMGERMLALYDTVTNRSFNVVTRLLLEGTSLWFDRVDTPVRETRDDIVRLSLEEAIRELRGLLGGELKEWRWGRLHKVTFEHVFGAEKLLRSIFNVGPFEVPGAHSTVWKGDFRLSRPFVNHAGPSLRLVADLSNPNNTRIVIPPGQSGHAFHSHYSDQMTLWLEAGYRRVVFDRLHVERANIRRLVLKPER